MSISIERINEIYRAHDSYGPHDLRSIIRFTAMMKESFLASMLMTAVTAGEDVPAGLVRIGPDGKAYAVRDAHAGPEAEAPLPLVTDAELQEAMTAMMRRQILKAAGLRDEPDADTPNIVGNANSGG